MSVSSVTRTSDSLEDYYSRVPKAPRNTICYSTLIVLRLIFLFLSDRRLRRSPFGSFCGRLLCDDLSDLYTFPAPHGLCAICPLEETRSRSAPYTHLSMFIFYRSAGLYNRPFGNSFPVTSMNIS